VECKPSSARWRAEGVDAALMSATGRLCSTGCVNPGVFTVLVRERGLWAMLTDALGDPQGVVLEPGSTYRMWKDERGVLRFSEG